MNLYLLTTNGYGQFYVVAESTTQAEEKLWQAFCSSSSLFSVSGAREVNEIKILAKDQVESNLLTNQTLII